MNFTKMANGPWFRHNYIFAIILLFVVSPRVHATKCLSVTTKGYTYPEGDIVIEYGNALEITCVVDDEDYLRNVTSKPSQHLYFKRNSSNISNFEILNDTSIRIHEHINMSSSVYYCMLPNNDVVCMNTVTVGAKPAPVEDFSCISQNYDNLTCTWTPPNNYVKTDYDLKYFFPGRAGRMSPNSCPKIDDAEKDGEKMKCFWNLSTKPHYRQAQQTYNFFLTMTNAFGTTKTNYTFDHFKYVKAGPPENLVGLNATTESILLSWKIPNSIVTFSAGLKYRILYQCEHQPKPKTWKLADMRFINDKYSVQHNLTGLYPHDLCDIRVSLRSNKSNDEEMWSSNSSITYRTASTIPSQPPKVNIGSFQVDKLYNMTTQDVYVYWQQIPDSFQNGDDFRYRVEGLGDYMGLVPNETTAAYAKFDNLLVSKNYSFAIWSENSEGRSEENTLVTVPAQVNRPETLDAFTKIVYKNGTFKLYFPPTEQSDSETPIKNFTIFWCRNLKDRPYQCTGYLNWTEVPATTTFYQVEVPDSVDAIWQFAISVNSEKYSSGMVWASCTLLHSKTIGKIKRLMKVGNTEATSIKLEWTLDCFDGFPSIDGYIIYYCPIVSPKQRNCKEPQKNITIRGNSDTRTGVVTGLKPYTTYMLSVAILTKNGDISEQSDFLQENTVEGAPSMPLNLSVIDVTNTSMKLLWHPPDELNGALKYYKIYYNGKETVVDPKSAPECNITSLDSFTTYNVSIKACTTVCSDSISKEVKTRIGVPDALDVRILHQNSSLIVVDWPKPSVAGSPYSYYQVQVNTKNPLNGYPHLFNETEPRFDKLNCGDDGDNNVFYVTARAVNVNVERTEVLYGAWSNDIEINCSNAQNIIYWLLLVFSIILVALLVFIIKRMFVYCKVMSNVELKLPPGLTPLPDWSNVKGLEEPEHIPSADEELLLVKMSESRIPSAESSGCSSGHGSVASECGTTMSSTSDSGTEQNELRKRSRNITNAPIRAPVNTGYVTMPEALSKPRVKPTGGCYSVLGVDPAGPSDASSPYVTVAPQDTAKNPYISCDAIMTPSTPYVLTGDMNKPASSSGYVPINYPELSEKNPAYVLAGAKNMLMPEHKTKVEEKPLYVQVSDVNKGTSETKLWQPPAGDAMLTKGYVSIGDAGPATNKRVVDPTKGYVPHRHFEAKLLKED